MRYVRNTAAALSLMLFIIAAAVTITLIFANYITLISIIYISPKLPASTQIRSKKTMTS